MRSTAGKELYLIPGIDMLNHSTLPQRRNTALQYSPPRVSDAAPSGAFSMTAGALCEPFPQHTVHSFLHAAMSLPPEYTCVCCRGQPQHRGS